MAGKLTKLLGFLKERSLLKDATAIPERFETENVSAYCGFDPTAPSLHLGHMVTLNALAASALYGIVPIAVIGEGTALIGDPSGKTFARPQLDPKIIQQNAESIGSQISQIFSKIMTRVSAQNPPALKLVNNAEIYKDLRLLTFLREVGYFFPLKPLLAKDMIQARADGLTYTEFSYQLLQAYDYAWLYRNHGCVLQIGGSDQWGNITTGTELIRKWMGMTVCGATLPLITTESGEKFGKSEGNALFFASELTSPYRIFQYCYNLSDGNIKTLLQRLTFLSIEEIETLCALPTEQRRPQIALATELITILHSSELAKTAENLSSILFSKDYTRLSLKEISLLKQSTSVIPVHSTSVQESLLNLLVKSAVLDSKSAGRKLILQKALHVNGMMITQTDVTLAQLTPVVGFLYRRISSLSSRAGRRPFIS